MKGVFLMAKKQTAGRDQLGAFAPKFAELNDDVLFGQVWSREKELSPRDRSFLTVTALITKGAFDQLGETIFKVDEEATKSDPDNHCRQPGPQVGWRPLNGLMVNTKGPFFRK